MIDTVQKSFGIHLNVLRMFGMFPSQFNIFYTLYTYFVYVVMIMPIPLSVTVNLVLKENIDIVLISDNAFLVCQMACLVTKLMPFVRKAGEIRRSIDMLKSPIFTQYTEKQGEIMNQCVETCRRNCLLFLGFCVCSLITWAIKPFVKNDRKLPLEIWVPVDLSSQPNMYYYTMYLYIVLGVTAGAFINGAIDPLIAGLAYFATTQLRILKNNLEFLGEEGSNPGAKIRDCIDHHVAILEFIAYYESVYSGVVFSQFIASVFVICMSCFYLSIVEPFSVLFFSMLIFLTTMLAEIFLYCYYGTLLFEENSTLTTAVYMGEWYKYDVSSRKALLVLMERSKKPMIVTAGKILDLSLETFTTILRRAYSLLAVLKNY